MISDFKYEPWWPPEISEEDAIAFKFMQALRTEVAEERGDVKDLADLSLPIGCSPDSARAMVSAWMKFMCAWMVRHLPPEMSFGFYFAFPGYDGVMSALTSGNTQVDRAIAIRCIEAFLEAEQKELRACPSTNTNNGSDDGASDKASGV